MARTITEDVERGNYKSEAVIVWCFDARFWRLLKEFIDLEEYRHPDIILIDGGARKLASNDFHERDTVTAQIQASIERHRTGSIILMMHAGCETNDLTFYQDSEEIEFYTEELKKAKAAVQFALGGDTYYIRTFFADFYGLTEFYT